jgi:predicted nuclease with TOPRIM domain
MIHPAGDLRARLGQRLDELKAEFTRGQDRLTQLDGEVAQLRQTLLRISGAIQVLEETLAAEKALPPEPKSDDG